MYLVRNLSGLGFTLSTNTTRQSTKSHLHQTATMEQPASRLRKTFQYPTENDSDDLLPEAIDEEGQSVLF